MSAKRILYVQYTNPAAYPPLQHSSRILAQAGWEVLFVGIGAHGADDLRFPVHPNIEVRRWRYRSPGLLQKLHYLAFNARVVWTCAYLRPGWIYASDILSSPVALFLHLLGSQVLYHEHDHPGVPASRFYAWLHRCRIRLGKRASLVVIPNERRMQAFQEETGRTKPTFCVWNCPAQNEALIEPEKARDAMTIFYHGSIVPSRLPLTMIDALASLPENVRLELAGYETIGHTGYVRILLNRAAELGVSPRVHYLGTLPTRDSLLEECRKAHFGVALMPVGDVGDVNERMMAGASNKPFDYLACGLALLVSDLPDWREFYEKAGVAQVCDPRATNSITAALQSLTSNPAAVREMGEIGRARIASEWNYETQFESVHRALDTK